MRIFFIISIVTFLIGLLKVLIIRQVILQWSGSKIKSSSDYRVSAAKKVSGQQTNAASALLSSYGI